MTTPYTSPDRKVTCWRCGMRLPESEADVERFPSEGRNVHAACRDAGIGPPPAGMEGSP